MNIRTYKQQDYDMLNNWWKHFKEPGPSKDMMSETSSFILEINNKPILSVTLYLTNIKEFCYVENFIKNPELKNAREAIIYLLNYISIFAKELGYKKLVCLGYRNKINKIYEEIGFVKTLENISSFVKEL